MKKRKICTLSRNGTPVAHPVTTHFLIAIPAFFSENAALINCELEFAGMSSCSAEIHSNYLKLNSVALVCKKTIPTERSPLVGEVSANLGG
jgi:hypothetical protein